MKRSITPGRRGFTLVELLTAIAIIAILISMAFLGYNYVSRNTREDVTNVAMQTAKALMTEVEHGGGNMNLQDYFEPWNANHTSRLVNYFNTADKPPLQVRAPTNMREGEANRFGPEATATQRFLRTAATIPECAKILANLPAAAKVYPEPASGMSYCPGDELMVGGLYYKLGGNAKTSTPAPGGSWSQVASITPLIVDGQRNLILLVPGDGLSSVTQGGINDWRVTSLRPLKSGDAGYAAPNPLIGKPFFVAAGADGNYVTGDDNVYSFQK